MYKALTEFRGKVAREVLYVIVVTSCQGEAAKQGVKVKKLCITSTLQEYKICCAAMNSFSCWQSFVFFSYICTFISDEEMNCPILLNDRLLEIPNVVFNFMFSLQSPYMYFCLCRFNSHGNKIICNIWINQNTYAYGTVTVTESLHS